MDHSNSPSQTHTVNYSDSYSLRKVSSKTYKEKQRTTRIKDPTEEQLCQTIILMKEELPGRSLQKAIQMMYDYVIKKRPPEKIFCDYVPPLIHIPEAPTNYKYFPRDRAEITISYEKKHILQEQFQSEDLKLQYTEKRLVAKSYIAHGKCEQAAREQFIKVKRSLLKQKKEGMFPAPLRGQDYNKALNEALLESFRKLEWFLIENSILAIRPLPEEDADRIILIFSQEKATNYGYVIKKYLRFAYGLSNVTLQEIQTVELYLQLLKILYGKKVTAQAIQKFFIENKQSTVSPSPNFNYFSAAESNNCVSAQTQQYEICIIETYKLSKSYGKLFKEMSDKFKFSKGKCKQLMFGICKKALGLVATEAGKHNLYFPAITESLYHKIFCLKQCQDLRVNLLEFYRNPSQASTDDLFFLAEMTKELIQTDEATFEQCSSLDEEQLTDPFSSPFQSSNPHDHQMEP